MSSSARSCGAPQRKPRRRFSRLLVLVVVACLARPLAFFTPAVKAELTQTPPPTDSALPLPPPSREESIGKGKGKASVDVTQTVQQVEVLDAGDEDAEFDEDHDESAEETHETEWRLEKQQHKAEFVEEAPTDPFSGEISKVSLSRNRQHGRNKSDSWKEDPYVLKLAIPAQDTVALRGGTKQIEKNTNATVITPRIGEWYPYTNDVSSVHRGVKEQIDFPAPAHKIMLITGEAEKNVIEAFAEVLKKAAMNQEEEGEVKWDKRVNFLVPEEAVSTLIGSGGSVIRELQDAVTASVKIVSVPGDERMVVMDHGGSREALIKTAEWLLSKQDEYREFQTRRQMSTSYQPDAAVKLPATIYVKLEDDQIGLVIGKGGSTIQQLRRNFLVNAVVDSDMGLLKLEGAMGDVHVAHKFIVRLLDEPAGKPVRSRPLKELGNKGSVGSRPLKELADEEDLEEFVRSNELDDRSKERLMALDEAQQQIVMRRGFVLLGKVNNPDAVVASRIRDALR